MMLNIVLGFIFVANAQWWGSSPRWRNGDQMAAVYLDPDERSVTGSRFENKVNRGREGAACDCQGICGYGRGGDGHTMFANNKKSGAHGCHWCGHGQWDPSRGNHDKIVYCFEHKCNAGYVSICDQSKQLNIWHNSYSSGHRACTCTKAAAQWVRIPGNFASTTFTTSTSEFISYTYSVTNTHTVAIEQSATVGVEIEGIGASSTTTMSEEFSTAVENSWTSGYSQTREFTVDCGEQPTAWQYVIYMYDVLCASSDKDKRFRSKNSGGCALTAFVVAEEGVTCTMSRWEPPCCGPGANPTSPNDRKFCVDDYRTWTGQCDGYDSRIRFTSIENGQTNCRQSECPSLDSSGLQGHLAMCGATCGNNAYANVFVPSHVFNKPNMLSCSSRPSWMNNFFSRYCRYVQSADHVIFFMRRDCRYASFHASNYDFDTAYGYMKNWMTNKGRDSRLMVPIYYNNWLGVCDGRRLLEEEEKMEFSSCKCDEECLMWGDCCEYCEKAFDENEIGEGLSDEEWKILGPLRQTLSEEMYMQARDSFDKNQID